MTEIVESETGLVLGSRHHNVQGSKTDPNSIEYQHFFTKAAKTLLFSSVLSPSSHLCVSLKAAVISKAPPSICTQ